MTIYEVTIYEISIPTGTTHCRDGQPDRERLNAEMLEVPAAPRGSKRPSTGATGRSSLPGLTPSPARSAATFSREAAPTL